MYGMSWSPKDMPLTTKSQAPIICECCKAWLLKAGKRTFGGVAGGAAMSGDTVEANDDGEAEASQEREKDGKDLTGLLKHVQRLKGTPMRLPRN